MTSLPHASWRADRKLPVPGPRPALDGLASGVPAPGLLAGPAAEPWAAGFLMAGAEHLSVSVVVPVRGNETTIRAAVDSILGQDYPGLRELLLVGSPGDSTWRLLDEYGWTAWPGVMRSIRDDFWGRFVDRNQLSAKDAPGPGRLPGDGQPLRRGRAQAADHRQRAVHPRDVREVPDQPRVVARLA